MRTSFEGLILVMFCQILEEHKLQGQEDQALEKRVEGKKAAAKKRAARKGLYLGLSVSCDDH